MSDSVSTRKSKRTRQAPKKNDTTYSAPSAEPQPKAKKARATKKVVPTTSKAKSTPKPRAAPKSKAKKSKKLTATEKKLEALFRSDGIMSIFTSSTAVQQMRAALAYDTLSFGPQSCKSIDRESGTDEKLLQMARAPNPHTVNSVNAMVVASYPPAESMRGQRGQRTVTEMMHAWTIGGLFTMNQATNDLVAPAARHVFTEMAKLTPGDSKRKDVFETLAEACIDCQQVQAREVMRIFSDLTNQTVTLEHQMLYFLSKKKENALNSLISTFHPDCDLDWTRVQASQQRPHLMSAYISLLTEDFGIPGVVTARADRFMREATGQLFFKSKDELSMNLMQMLDVKEFVEELLSDINNQVGGMDHLISQKVIFEWVSKHADVLDPHTVFYDDARADEFKDQTPNKPKDENQYEPFLSRFRLQQILLVMGVLAVKE